MTKPRAITVIKLDPPAERKDEWNEWYSNKHSPERFKIVPNEPHVDTLQGVQAQRIPSLPMPG